MIPVLIQLHFITIYTFGVFLLLAFFWGAYLLWKLGRLTSYKEEDLFDGLFISLIGALVWGRIMYILFHFSDFQFDLLKYMLINGYPGISLVGALCGGFITYVLFCITRKVKFSESADYAIPPLFLALAIGKLGAFFSGAEAGIVTKFPLAIKYANLNGLRHLTPLYESIAFFIGCFIANKILFQIRREHKPHSFNVIFFFWLFSLTYFLFDAWKSQHMLLLGISLYWPLSLVVLLTTTGYFIYYWRNLFIQLTHVHKTSHHSLHQGAEKKA